VPVESPATAVARAFLQLAPQLIRVMSSALDAQPGITLRQFRVLQQLAPGPCRARDLANSTGVTAPTMSAALANLQSRGLISRTPDPGDGRAALVEITTAGREAVDSTSNLLMGVLEGVAADISPADAEAASRICSVMLVGVCELLPTAGARVRADS
jgi:DNA-binding MarR family transcriptional regulator